MNNYIIIDGHNGEVTKLRLHYVGPIYQVPTFISMEANIIQLVLSCNHSYIFVFFQNVLKSLRG